MSGIFDEMGEPRARQLLADLEWFMSSVQGRRFLYWLLYVHCEIESLSVNLAIKSGDSCAIHAGVRDGRRGVGLDLKREMQRISPRQVLQMLDEATSAFEADQARLAEAQKQSAGDEL